jgi:hypothetical protein
MVSFDTSNSTGGNDNISTGGDDDYIIAGVGNDTVKSDAGENIAIGDDGRITSDRAGRFTEAVTGNTRLGGNDTLRGGSDRDIQFGGYGDDTLVGNAGDDLLDGDAGKVRRVSSYIIFETKDFFVGGDDSVNGGDGLDRMLGGYGSDLFYGNLSEDVIIGEYARLTFLADPKTEAEKASVIVTLAQDGLDLIKNDKQSLFRLGINAVNSLTASDFIRTADGRLTASSNRGLGIGETLENTFTTSRAAGVDLVLPTAPTAAGDNAAGDNNGDADVPADSDAQTQVDEGLPAVNAETTGVSDEGVEEPADEEKIETQEDIQENIQENIKEEQDDKVEPSIEQISVLDKALLGAVGWTVMRKQNNPSPKLPPVKLDRELLERLAVEAESKRFIRWENF